VANTPSADALVIQETKETFVNQIAGESIYDILITVSARVKNTGDWAASEVAQLVRPNSLFTHNTLADIAFKYVEFPAIEDQPPKILRGFTKLKDMAPASFP
jgi:beta-glucosidase